MLRHLADFVEDLWRISPSLTKVDLVFKCVEPNLWRIFEMLSESLRIERGTVELEVDALDKLDGIAGAGLQHLQEAQRRTAT